MFILLYVDDGALLFESHEEAVLGTNIMFDQMKIMGLSIHIGSKKKNQKRKLSFSCQYLRKSH